jgi:hypothetical protein
MRDNKHDGKVIPFSNDQEGKKAVELAENLGYTKWPSESDTPNICNCIFLCANGQWIYSLHEYEEQIPLDYLDESVVKKNFTTEKETVTVKECYLAMLERPNALQDYNSLVLEAHKAAKAFNERKESE